MKSTKFDDNQFNLQLTKTYQNPYKMVVCGSYYYHCSKKEFAYCSHEENFRGVKVGESNAIENSIQEKFRVTILRTLNYVRRNHCTKSEWKFDHAEMAFFVQPFNLFDSDTFC